MATSVLGSVAAAYGMPVLFPLLVIVAFAVRFDSLETGIFWQLLFVSHKRPLRKLTFCVRIRARGSGEQEFAVGDNPYIGCFVRWLKPSKTDQLIR